MLSTLREKLGTALVQLRYLPQVWSLVWTASRGWTVAWAVLLVVQGLIPVATVYLTRVLVDALVAAVASGLSWQSVSSVLWPAAFMGGALLLGEITSGALGLVREYQAELIQDGIAARIHDTSTSVDLAFYETPSYFDHLHRARNEAWYRPLKLVENAGTLAQSTITLLAMAVVLFRFSWWVPVVLIASTMPALFAVFRHAVRQHRSRLKHTPDERRTWYYDYQMTTALPAAELRLFSLGSYFKERYRTTRALLRTERLRLLKHRGRTEIGASIAALLGAAGCMAWMGWRTLNGALTLGELALFYAAFRQGQQMMRSLLGGIGDIYRNVLFLGDLFEFLGLKPGIVDPERSKELPLTLKSGIVFDNVTFAYPQSDRAVLRDFNLTIPSGQMVAIVGPNGSGKSTLLRLLCRLYDPQSGCVAFDGVDVRAFPIADLRKRITVLFQEPVHYSATVNQNLAFGDLDGNPGTAAIAGASRAAGLDPVVAALPDGYETLLGKWFEGGKELSVGEWQRVALARALLKDAPLILLDEPTSAMDSWAEADWMARLRSLIQGKTAVIITHRFTTAMRADIIHVMQGGAIVESGSHGALLAKGGLYATSWQSQMDLAASPP